MYTSELTPAPTVRRTDHGGGAPRRGVIAVTILLVVATLATVAAAAAAGSAYVEARHARDAVDVGNAALSRSAAEQGRLRHQLQDLSAAHRELRHTVAGLQAQLDQAPDDSAVVKQAARSVFTIRTSFGSGSGFVAMNRGGHALVVTNFHVIAGGYAGGDRTVTVQQDQRSFTGRVTEVAEGDDLAVISVGRHLPPLSIADRRPAVGDALLVLGSPLGLGGTVTSGIVSAYRDDFGPDYMQFSAPISPGNSGGPVIDQKGRVVGVAVAKMIGNGAEGLSFAIPAGRLCFALSVC